MQPLILTARETLSPRITRFRFEHPEGRPLPLFSGGANQARLSAAQARAEQARLAWQASVLKAVEEVENALAGYNRDARAVDAQSRLVSNASESVSLTQTSYELGEAGFFPVLDAERTLLTTAIADDRCFRKVLPYNGSSTALASLIFTDTAPAIAAFIDRCGGEDDDDDESIAGLPVWNWRTDEDMPDLPSPLDGSE